MKKMIAIMVAILTMVSDLAMTAYAIDNYVYEMEFNPTEAKNYIVPS